MYLEELEKLEASFLKKRDALRKRYAKKLAKYKKGDYLSEYDFTMRVTHIILSDAYKEINIIYQGVDEKGQIRRIIESNARKESVR